MKFIGALPLWLGLVSLAAAQNDSTGLMLDPSRSLQAQRSNAVTYEVDFSVVVTPPYKTNKLQVWLPIPANDFGQEVSASRLSSFPISVEPKLANEKKYGNRFAYFEFISPQGAQIIRHQFRIKVWELRWNIEPAKVAIITQWPADFEKYRGSDSKAVVVDERFDKLLREIVPGQGTPLDKLDGVMNWVQTNFEYDHHDASLQASSEHGLTKRRGHCSDYHSFCAAMGRVIGVPTLVAYGINPFPKNSPSHCKLEAYLPPYGWVSFDVSETQKLVGQIEHASELDDAAKKKLIEAARARLIGGFRDNTWFAQTRGTDYELVPEASQRVAVVRTAYIEADGVPLPEPDPGDPAQTAFTWMTVHEYRADRTVPYPYTDWKTLQTSESK